jgi:hypothetical protein
LKILLPMMLLLVIVGCAHPPQLSTSLDVRQESDGVILLKLKVTNLEDRVTVPIAIDLSGQSEINGHWEKASSLLHPAAFVLNRKEQREITKQWKIQADAIRTTLVVREQETGNLLKSEKAEKSFATSK